MAYDTRPSRHRSRGRSSSIDKVITRMLPSHRPEKGHTIRTSSEAQETEATLGSEGYQLNSQDERRKSSFELIYGHVRSRSRSKTWPAVDRNECDAPQQEKKSTMKRILGSIRSPMFIGKSSSEKNRTKLAVAVAAEYYKEKEITKTQRVYEEKEITTSQQIYEEKRARRQQRRSLKESGDFLGVQGANPRTGTWDISDSTSSEPSEMAEEVRRQLAGARETTDEEKRYEQVQHIQQIELLRVQALRDQKQRAKLERKEQEKRLRRQGKWQLSDNGWTSVAEPDLSPIAQSLAGTSEAGTPEAGAPKDSKSIPPKWLQESPSRAGFLQTLHCSEQKADGTPRPCCCLSTFPNATHYNDCSQSESHITEAR